MALSTKQLYLFLVACSGNWRNSIYIKCQGEKDAPGYLLAADRDDQPVILAVQQFYQLTGTWIDPAECCGQLTEANPYTPSICSGGAPHWKGIPCGSFVKPIWKQRRDPASEGLRRWSPFSAAKWQRQKSRRSRVQSGFFAPCVKKYYSALTVWIVGTDIERGLFSVGRCAILGSEN